MNNIALVGSNFGLRGYLPVIQSIKDLDLKIICSRDQNKISKTILKNVNYVNNWKKIFKKNIDIIILAVPPKLQEEIILFNLKSNDSILSLIKVAPALKQSLCKSICISFSKKSFFTKPGVMPEYVASYLSLIIIV